jgi:hypothetical protein
MAGILAVVLFIGLVGALLWILMDQIWKDRNIGS